MEQHALKLIHKELTELRRRAVASVQAGESSKVFGISRMTIYNWLTLYRRGGWHALDAKKRGGRLPEVERQGYTLGVQHRDNEKSIAAPISICPLDM